MKITPIPNAPGGKAEGSAATRIVIGTDTIEFLDQPFIITEPDAEPKDPPLGLGPPPGVGKNRLKFTTDSGFLMSSLVEAWPVIVKVPINDGAPARAAGENFVDSMVAIDWTKDPVEVVPYAGPTIDITIGQAVSALTAYADMLRKPEATPVE